MPEINGDYDQYVANSHEQAMKETRVEIAKIEAKRDVDKAKLEHDKAVKVAKVNNTDRKALFAWAAFLAVVAVIAGCITYGSTRPVDPTEVKYNQERYELCMQVEEDESKC